MNVLALDMSTKPGYALFVEGKLTRYGTLWADKKAEEFGPYPFNYVKLAEHTIERLTREVINPALKLTKAPLEFVVEETTASHSGLTQKKLEFIHFALLKKLEGRSVTYVQDGRWKKVVGAKMSDAEKLINAQIKEYKEKHGTKLAKLDLDGSGVLKVVGKRTPQHVYLRVVRETLGLTLSLKEEDSGAAICLGLAHLKGVQACDGITKKKKTKSRGSK